MKKKPIPAEIQARIDRRKQLEQAMQRMKTSPASGGSGRAGGVTGS